MAAGQLVRVVGGGRDSRAATCGLVNTVNMRIKKSSNGVMTHGSEILYSNVMQRTLHNICFYVLSSDNGKIGFLVIITFISNSSVRPC